MNNRQKLSVIFIIIFSVTSLYSQVIKAAIIQDPDVNLINFYNILSERSGIPINQIPLLREEIENALKEGIVDIAVLPDNEKTTEVALIQTEAFGKNYVLISNRDVIINDYNLIDLKTIAVNMDDEAYLNEALIDRFTIDPKIQKARHYDSLIRIIKTGRADAIFIPIEEFERSLRNRNEDRGGFGQPYEVGFRNDFLVLSRRRAEKLAPLMNRIIQSLKSMKEEGLMEDLNRSS